MAKRYNGVFFTALLLLLGLFSGIIAWVDPMYHYHAPTDGRPLSLTDGRYQNASVARNFDYDCVLMGTSVSANFSTAQIDAALGCRTVKLIVLDGYLSDFDQTLKVVFEGHSPRYVLWGLDSNILGRGEAAKTVDLPAYLYNKSLLDDVHYLLNKDVALDAIELLRMWKNGETGTMDTAYYWAPSEWSAAKALRSYPRPSEISPPKPADFLLENARKNLDVVLEYVEQYPDTTFKLYLAPYSILYWDKAAREGLLDAVLEMHRTVLGTLGGRPNVELYYFMDRTEIITDLSQYGDHIHYAPAVNALMAREMAEGAALDPADTAARLSRFRSFLAGWDFEQYFR